MRIIKFIGIGLLIILIGLCLLYYIFIASIQPKVDSNMALSTVAVTRISDRPIIHSESSQSLIDETAKFGYTNINGPSIIRVPDWVENSLGQYYLYFAHHKGENIRMAYTDSIGGDWVIHNEPVLTLSQSGLPIKSSGGSDLEILGKYNSWSEIVALMRVGKDAKQAFEKRNQNATKSQPPTTPHIASPDVVIDHENKQMRLYFHGLIDGRLQMSKVALSNDGIHFSTNDDIITLPYLRMFQYRDAYYGIAMPGFLYRSEEGLSDFKVRKRWLFEPNARHFGIWLDGEKLHIFYTIVGDVPERIMHTQMDLSSSNWNDWMVGNSQEVLRPSQAWEGINEPLLPSIRGEMSKTVNQLRDPDIFQDVDGQLYMTYTGGGEQAIGLTHLKILPNYLIVQ